MSDVMEQVKAAIESNKVVLFIKGTPEAPQCGFSAATVQILKDTQKPFKSFDVLSNPEIREKLPEYSQWPTFPQVFINGKLVGGCDIIHELKESGELNKLLEDAFKS